MISSYRFLRARRVVENAFEILVQRFRFLLSDLQQNLENIWELIKAAIVLHNLMCIRYPQAQNTARNTKEDNRNIVLGQCRKEVYMCEFHNLSLEKLCDS